MSPWLKATALATVAALAPVHATMIVVGVLIVADTITGVWAARKRGERIHSGILGRTVTKMAVYQTAVITGYLTQAHLTPDFVPVLKLVTCAIAAVEMLSIAENLQHILGQPFLRSVIQALSSKNQKKD
jgi:hypothetical protein